MNIAIIAAAGAGTRMASDRPKQFLLLAGTPVIVHTLKVFEQCESIHEVILVLPAAESAKRGLIAIRAATAEIVAVHDGVRPFVTTEEIDATVAAAQADGAAILVAPLTDTIKQVGDQRVEKTLDRRGLRRALTPQCFRYELLRNAYQQADVNDPSLTDESALVEQLGHSVSIVEGSARNIKITSVEDLAIAESILATASEDP